MIRRADVLPAGGSLILGGCLAAALLFASAASLEAEPYIAVRTGYKCSQCHVNRTGGGKRTEFGMVYAQTSLPMMFIRPADGPAFTDGMLSEFVSVGANFRANDETLLEYQSPQGESVGTLNQIRIAEANIYFQFDLIPTILIFYMDQTLTPLNANREAFGLVQGLPLDSYFKFGRMLLPYGLRLLDDDAFVRNRTGFTYDRHDKGFEMGLEPVPLSLVGNVTETQASVVGSVVYENLRVGGSYGRETKRRDSNTVGVFGGVNLGRATLLGEVDYIKDGDIDKYALIGELDFLVLKGMNFKAIYEFFDADRNIANDRDGRDRVTVGLEPFVTQFLQVGLFYRDNNFIPQNLTENQDELVLQFHVFF